MLESQQERFLRDALHLFFQRGPSLCRTALQKNWSPVAARMVIRPKMRSVSWPSAAPAGPGGSFEASPRFKKETGFHPFAKKAGGQKKKWRDVYLFISLCTQVLSDFSPDCLERRNCLEVRTSCRWLVHKLLGGSMEDPGPGVINFYFAPPLV